MHTYMHVYTHMYIYTYMPMCLNQLDFKMYTYKKLRI